MESLKLYYYKYCNILHQFKRLDANDGPYPIRELTNIIEFLDNQLIQYEVDEKFNIQLRKSANIVADETLIKQNFS